MRNLLEWAITTCSKLELSETTLNELDWPKQGGTTWNEIEHGLPFGNCPLPSMPLPFKIFVLKFCFSTCFSYSTLF